MKDTKFAWYAFDIALFLVGVAVLCYLVHDMATTPCDWQLFVALCFGTFRLADIISTEEVTRVIRAPFEGHTKSFRGAVAQGIKCPSCTGVWSAAVLVALVTLAPGWGPIPVYILAFTGAERIISRTVNVLDKRG